MPNLNNVMLADVLFLRNSQLIDYSLLLGQLNIDLHQLRQMCGEDPSLGRGVFIDDQDRAWMMGIIDPLTSFNTQKKLEYYYKTLKYRGSTKASCVPPEAYACRFTNFMSGILKFEGNSGST